MQVFQPFRMGLHEPVLIRLLMQIIEFYDVHFSCLWFCNRNIVVKPDLK